MYVHKLFVLSGEVICYFSFYVCLFSIVRFEVSWDSGRDDDVIEFLTTKQDLPWSKLMFSCDSI